MAMEKKTSSGRPPKFKQPRRPVTVTLPQRTLDQLAAIDPDRAKAIVACVDAMAAGTQLHDQPLELIEVAPRLSLIVVGPSRSLRRIPWLRLVEIAPRRFLLSMPGGTAVASLEVAILDLIEHLPPEDEAERTLLVQLREHLTHQRRQDTLTKGEILFVAVP